MPTDRSSTAARDLIFVQKRSAGLPAAFSIGDSWFDYPIYENVIDRIDDTDLFAIKRHELSGALLGEVRAQITGPDQLKAFGADVLLVSGGGNDLVIKEWIRTLFVEEQGQADPASLIDDDVWQAQIERFQAAYQEIVDDFTSAGITVVVHGYDYLIPTGKGVLFDFWRGKPWVQPALIEKGIVDPARQRFLGHKIVEDFNDRVVKPLDTGDRFPDGRKTVVYVDCRGAITPESEWANELHPTKRGFEEVAARFVPLLHDLLDPRGVA
jgi:hypothetical protein